MGNYAEAKVELLKADDIFAVTGVENSPYRLVLKADIYKCDQALGPEADDMMFDTLILKHH